MSERSLLEMYQSFMNGYVKRVNEATFNVPIKGVRIGTAKYTRLAQINLQSRVITFSRYAVENVPERGRRYLVLHELAHVHEANHSKKFWHLVARFEPSYQQVGRALDKAFKTNVKEEQKQNSTLLLQPGFDADSAREAASRRLLNYKTDRANGEQSIIIDPLEIEEEAELDGAFGCSDDEFSGWEDHQTGTMIGGSDIFETSDLSL